MPRVASSQLSRTRRALAHCGGPRRTPAGTARGTLRPNLHVSHNPNPALRDPLCHPGRGGAHRAPGLRSGSGGTGEVVPARGGRRRQAIVTSGSR